MVCMRRPQRVHGWRVVFLLVLLGLVALLAHSASAPAFAGEPEFGDDVASPAVTGCAAPGLISPVEGEVLASRTVTFQWNAVSGCTFSGYTFRICTSADVTNAGNCFLDATAAGTQRVETISGHDNVDLWWGVKATSAPEGASWAIRRFRISPIVQVDRWSASYFPGRSCWDDHDTCTNPPFSETIDPPGGGTLLDKNWVRESPGPGIETDNWTGQFLGTFAFPPAKYVFYATHDDDLKLKLGDYDERTAMYTGNETVLCNGTDGYALSGEVPLALYFREGASDAYVSLRWSTDTSICSGVGAITGSPWNASYFNSRSCYDDHNNCGNPDYSETVPVPGSGTLLDKNWGLGSPGPGVGDSDWTGLFAVALNFAPAKYVFYASQDDDMKLRLGSYDERTITYSPTEVVVCNGTDGYFLNGSNLVRLYFREGGGEARVSLRWDTDTSACLTLPAVPTGLAASDGTFPDRIALTWTAPASGTCYELWRNVANESSSATKIHACITAAGYEDTILIPGQTYYYWLKARNIRGTSALSASESGHASLPVPAVPTGVTASDGTYPDRIRLSWAAVCGASSYEVWRNTSNSSGSATLIGPAVTTTVYEDTGASIGQTHYYWVKAKNGSAASGFSAVDSGYSGDFNTPPDKPGTPSPAHDATGVSIKPALSWTGADPDAGDTLSYTVYIGTSAGSLAQKCGPSSSTTCNPGTLLFSTDYYWQVVATDNHGLATTGDVWHFQSAPASDAVYLPVVLRE